MGGIASGLQHPAVGRTQRAGRHRIGEYHAFSRQAVDVGRGDVPTPVDTAHVGAELVGKHEEDVRFLPPSQPTACRHRHARSPRCRQTQKCATVHWLVDHGMGLEDGASLSRPGRFPRSAYRSLRVAERRAGVDSGAKAP